MTSFEYLSVLVAIVIALGIAQLLNGVGGLALGGSELRTYWVHSLWLVSLLLVFLHTWWSMWKLRDATDHSVLLFLFYLLGTGLPFVASYVLLAGSFPADAEAHYFRVRRRFFGIMAAGSVWAFVHHNQVLESPSRGIPQLIMAPVLLWMAASASRPAHAIVSVLFLLGVSIGIAAGPGEMLAPFVE